MAQRDVVIAGAGIIGLSCALELQALGMRVTVLERGTAARQASWAAAGMLAAHDPANPPELEQFAAFSVDLYPEFLRRLWTLGGMRVPLETDTVYEDDQWYPLPIPARSFRGIQGKLLARREDSLDPRKLIHALQSAVSASSVELLEGTAFLHADKGTIVTSAGSLTCGVVIDCRGAWAGMPLRPTKGQMLRVHAPGVLPGVVRTRSIYMVPRLDGSVLIGATVEDAGFDISVHTADLDRLRAHAAALAPELADAPLLESWAGLRPDTPDHLPLIGHAANNHLIASGHFRNGILLAPGTARVIAQLVTSTPTAVDLSRFDPKRFPHEDVQPIFASTE